MYLQRDVPVAEFDPAEWGDPTAAVGLIHIEEMEVTRGFSVVRVTEPIDLVVPVAGSQPAVLVRFSHDGTEIEIPVEDEFPWQVVSEWPA